MLCVCHAGSGRFFNSLSLFGIELRLYFRVRHRQDRFKGTFESRVLIRFIRGGVVRIGTHTRRNECVSMSAKSQSEILQKLHNIENILGEARKQVTYWEALENTCLLDGYCEGKLSLILYLNVLIKDNDIRGRGESKIARSANNVAVRLFHHNALNASSRRQFEEKQVLIRNIECVKSMENASLPSFVGLYVGYNDLEEGGATGLYFQPMKGVFDLLPGIPNRELIEVRDSSRNVFIESARPPIIEGCTEIVKGISDNQGQVQESIFMFRDIVYQALISSITVMLNCRSLSIYESENSILRISDMFIGPLNFQPSISKNCTHNKELTTF